MVQQMWSFYWFGMLDGGAYSSFNPDERYLVGLPCGQQALRRREQSGQLNLPEAG